MCALRLFLWRGIARSKDHSLGRRTTPATVGTRKTCNRQSRKVHSLKFKPLAAVDCHQPNSIKMQCCGWNLAQIALLSQQYQLPHPIKGTLDRKAPPHRAPLARKVEELPDCNSTHALRYGRGSANLLSQVRMIEQKGGEKLPGVGTQAQAIHISGKALDAFPPRCRQTGCLHRVREPC